VARTKKRAQENRLTLVFVDESGFSPTPFVRKTWAPRGERPEFRHRQGKWEKINAVSAVTSDQRLFFQLQDGDGFNKHDFARFTQHLLRHIRGDVAILWDNLPAHHSKVVTGLVEKHSRLRFAFLPPYSPDFNPDEGVWNHAKLVDLANFAAKDTTELKQATRTSLRRLQRRPTKITDFWRQTHLPLTGLESLLNLPEPG